MKINYIPSTIRDYQNSFLKTKMQLKFDFIKYISPVLCQWQHINKINHQESMIVV